MQIQTLTFEQLVGTAAVILLLVGIYNTVMSAIKTQREEKRRREQPVSDLEQKVNDHEQKLINDHERMNDMEGAIRILMRSQIAQLDHAISGNSVDKLRESKDEILDYLSKK